MKMGNKLEFGFMKAGNRSGDESPEPQGASRLLKPCLCTASSALRIASTT